jgi:hypothetical protein
MNIAQQQARQLLAEIGNLMDCTQIMSLEIFMKILLQFI